MTSLLNKNIGNHKFIKEIRSMGLFIGVELKENIGLNGKDIVYKLLGKGVLCKQTQENTIRMAPPLTIDELGI